MGRTSAHMAEMRNAYTHTPFYVGKTVGNIPLERTRLK
jgi:hypothetical protein